MPTVQYFLSPTKQSRAHIIPGHDEIEREAGGKKKLPIPCMYIEEVKRSWQDSFIQSYMICQSICLQLFNESDSSSYVNACIPNSEGSSRVTR